MVASTVAFTPQPRDQDDASDKHLCLPNGHRLTWFSQIQAYLASLIAKKI
jgi:hypothetical protein